MVRAWLAILVRLVDGQVRIALAAWLALTLALGPGAFGGRYIVGLGKRYAVVVVRVGDSLEAWRIEEIGKTVKEAVGDHKVLVVAHNITLEVIEKT